MTFAIDTGAPSITDMIPGWFLDQIGYPETAEEISRAVHAFGYHLIGATKDPKKIDTVRKHAMAQWAFLRVLAETHPGVFDEFVCAYAERVLAFD